MHVVVFLQVCQLRETLAARLAFERSFAGMRPKVHLQVGQLTESLATHVALVVHLAVLLADRIRQRPVAARVASAAGASARRHVIGRHGTGRRAARARLHLMVAAGVMALVAGGGGGGGG